MIPIDERTAATLRDQAVITQVADTSPGYPCRLCLRDARSGETLVLATYDPFRTKSPYRGASAIYLHQSPCVRWSGDQIPEQIRVRRLSLRAFDEREMMVASDVVDGVDFISAAERLLEVEGVAFLHVHNAAPGCWALRVERSLEGE